MSKRTTVIVAVLLLAAGFVIKYMNKVGNLDGEYISFFSGILIGASLGLLGVTFLSGKKQ